MGKPVLIAVTDDLAVLAALKDQLPRRYDRDYDIAAADSGVAGIAHLDELRLAGRQVAIVLAYQWLPDMTGIDFLSRAHELFPAAKRVLLITYGDTSTTEPILQALTLGQLDYYRATPWGPPEERLYPAITELLSQWTR